MHAMKIGEASRQSGVGIETIRYYEREGLLDPPLRRPSGYREYDMSAVARLQFIRRAKELGFTLSEIKELLGFWRRSNPKSQTVRQRVEQKVQEIDEKIRSLQRMKRSLQGLIRECGHRKSPRECPLLDGL